MSYLKIRGQKYYYRSTHYTWKGAYNAAHYAKKKYGQQYYIKTAQVGTLFPITKFHLYLTKKT